MACEWENFVAGVLDAQGISFKREVWFGSFRADFVLVGLDIVIEIDDPGHNDYERHRRDSAKDAAYHERGFTVIRIKNLDLDNRLDETIQALLRTVNKRVLEHGGDPLHAILLNIPAAQIARPKKQRWRSILSERGMSSYSYTCISCGKRVGIHCADCARRIGFRCRRCR